MAATITVTGIAETRAALDRFDRELTAQCRTVIAATIARVHQRAYQFCPVGSEPGSFPGHVRDQIRSQLSADKPSGAVWVERRGIGGRWGTDNVGIWLEFGTVHAAAHPFMRPAVDPERESFVRTLQAVAETCARNV